MGMSEAIKPCHALRATIIVLVVAWLALPAAACEQELAQAKSMIEVLRASRDRTEDTLAKVHAYLQQLLREREGPKAQEPPPAAEK